MRRRRDLHAIAGRHEQHHRREQKLPCEVDRLPEPGARSVARHEQRHLACERAGRQMRGEEGRVSDAAQRRLKEAATRTETA